MTLRRASARVLTLAGACGGLALVLAGVARPWYRSWGASGIETRMALPGDEIVVRPHASETRAITINAPAAAVWPWLAQLGQDRGGFYSYEILEDLVGCRMPDIQRLDPALQHWRVGDKLWMYPPDRAGGIGFAELAVFQPGRAMGFATRQPGTPVTAAPDGSWSFVVLPIDQTSSRLIIRGRAAGGQGTFASAFSLAVFEPAHFVMERRTMETIKTLAEGGRSSQAMNNLQVALWTLTFAAFVAAAILVLAGRHAGRRLVTLVAAGLLFQVLTLVQPSPWVGLVPVILLFAALFEKDPAAARARR